MTSWREFWNGAHRIYVNERHKDVHYARIAADIRRLVPHEGAVVLDHGCGEALHAEHVAAACGRLLLCDAAPSVRERLRARYMESARIRVLAPEDVEELPEASLDLVVANSLAQYLSRDELKALLALWRRLLKPGGRLVLADIVPPETRAWADVAALLRLAARERFLGAALAGLAATYFSPYRRLRGSLGLTHYAEAEMLATLAEAGFRAERLRPNLGFNQSRLAFSATRRQGEGACRSPEEAGAPARPRRPG